MRKCGMTFLMVFSIMLFTSCDKKTDYSFEFSTTGCFGNCPILDIKLEDSMLYFNFIEFNEKKGLFSILISNHQKREISNLVDRILTEQIKDEYLSEVLDVPATYFHLYEDDKEIIRTNYDNHIAPKSIENLFNYLLGLSSSNQLNSVTFNVEFRTRKEINTVKFVPPPPPLKKNTN